MVHLRFFCHRKTSNRRLFMQLTRFAPRISALPRGPSLEQPIATQSSGCLASGLISRNLDNVHIRNNRPLTWSVVHGGEDEIRTRGRITPTAV